MTYPNVLAHGVDSLGRHDWNDVIACIEKTISAQAADGVAIKQFDVLTYDEDGRLTQWLATSDYAQAIVTFSGNPVAAETMAVNGSTINFVSALTTGAQVLIETAPVDTVANLVDSINGDPDTYAVTASVDATGLIVTLSAIEAGTGGNAIALTESATNVAVSGATLSGATADKASGTLTFGAIAVATQTITINGAVVTWMASGATGNNQANIGTTATTSAQNLKTLLNAYPGIYGVTAAGTANILALTAIAEGAAGNLVTLAKSNVVPTLSGPTLTGGSVAEDDGSIGPVAVAMESVPASTPGGMVPICIDGMFNHVKLGWPASVATLAQRRRAVANSSIVVIPFL